MRVQKYKKKLKYKRLIEFFLLFFNGIGNITILFYR